MTPVTNTNKTTIENGHAVVSSNGTTANGTITNGGTITKAKNDSSVIFGPKVPYRDDITIHDYFDELVKELPTDTVAIEHDGQRITYLELNEKANLLARKIVAANDKMVGQELHKRNDDKKECFIALYMDKGIDMIVAMLAVFKAGGAYVPLSPHAPMERNMVVLTDVKPIAIVTQEQYIESLGSSLKTSSLPAAIIDVDTEKEDTQKLDHDVVLPNRTPNDLAYLIPTSGTTGVPKGVMIAHKNVLHIIVSSYVSYFHPETKRALFFASYTFDSSIIEIFTVLLNKLTVVICPENIRNDPYLLGTFLVDQKIDWATIPPAMAQAMDIEGHFKHLKTLVLAGEASSEELLKRAYAIVPQVFNAIGPTEATVCCAVNQYKIGDKRNNVGQAIPNVNMYILDAETREPVPNGEPGELYIGGEGVGRGYYNRDQLNLECFVNDPFVTSNASNEGSKMYKSGDLVQILPNGDMEFLGRIDRQVKIRSHRIELGEIESVLVNQFDGVRQAVVIDIEMSGNKTLAAYIVVDTTTDTDDMDDATSVRDKMANFLPEYMIPTSYTKIDQVPLTINGKLDRNALPKPAMMTSKKQMDPKDVPQTDMERFCCGVWAKVLSLKEIGINDNFFHSGGDSISCLQVLYKIRSKYGMVLEQLRAKHIYDAPTIKQFAKVVEELMKASEENSSKPNPDTVVADQGKISGPIPNLPIQEWFYKNLDKPHPNHFNQDFTLQLQKDHEYSSDDISKAILDLAEHHDMLRCTFKDRTTTCQDEAPVVFHDLRDSVIGIEEKKTKWQTSLDIEKGPVWRVALHSQNKLWFVFHHLIIDVVSWRIIADDMETLLAGGKLGPKTCSYQQWSNYVKEYADKNQKRQVPYWKSMLGPIDNFFASETSLPSNVRVTVGPQETSMLLKQCHQAYNTEINDLLVAALAKALATVTGRDKNPINLEGIGRISNDVDVSRTVGWFTSLHPLTLDASGLDVGNAIVQAKEVLRAVPDKGLGWGALVQAGYLTNDRAPVVFNYLGQLGGTHNSILVDESGEDIATGNHDWAFSIEINGAVDSATGELYFDIMSYLNESKTEMLSNALKASILDVVDHTIAIQEPIKTPSDYKMPGLTVASLRQLQAKYHHGIEEIYSVSSLQEAFLAHAVLHPQDDAYKLQMLFEFEGDFDPESYRKAWLHAIEKYPTLRCCFEKVGTTTPAMIVTKNVEAPEVEILNLRGNTDISLEDICLAERSCPFNLKQPGLIRIKAVQTQEKKFTILVLTHHIILDGWSQECLFNTVSEAYSKLTSTGQCPSLKIDRAFFEANTYRMASLDQAREYWMNEAKLSVPGDMSFLFNKAYSEAHDINLIDQPAETKFVVSKEATRRLEETCRQYNVTVNAAVQLVYHQLLQIYTHEETTVVGTTVAGRDIPVEEIESSSGNYINTLPLTLCWDNPKASVIEMLKQVQDRLGEIGTYFSMSLSEITNKVGERPFVAVSVFDNFAEVATSDKDIFRLVDVREKLDLPLGLTTALTDGSIKFTLNYNASWLEIDRARDILQEMANMLEYIAYHPEEQMWKARAAAVSASDYKMMIEEWNETTHPFPDVPAHKYFEKIVEQQPDAEALVFKDESITYRELNQRANRMARAIREAVGAELDRNPDRFIALYLGRDFNMVVTVLAVLKVRYSTLRFCAIVNTQTESLRCHD